MTGPTLPADPPIPDLPLETPEGGTVRLHELFDREFLLLIALRHLT